MRVSNMTSQNGNEVPNQFIIEDDNTRVFQSYRSIIVRITHKDGRRMVELDRDRWDYSKTTGKYRNQFLGEDKKTTERKIASGEYLLSDLN